MATVRAKFIVNSIERNWTTVPKGRVDGKDTWGPGELWTVKLAPVYGNGDPTHENTRFWQASPSGQITLGTVNEGAVKAFELGAEYYVEFTKA